MKDLADSMTDLPRTSGLAARVYRLVHDMQALPPMKRGSDGGVVQTAGESASVRLNNVSIAIPSEADEKTVLIQDLSLDIQPGQATVIRGHNGVGKSSLFRVLSGLWSPQDGSTRIEVPAKTFFMPQDCYFPMGSLLDQVIDLEHCFFLVDCWSITSFLMGCNTSTTIRGYALGLGHCLLICCVFIDV